MTVRLSGKWTLSDEHAASSYGQAVLVDDLGTAYGPGDVVQLFPSWPWVTAAAAVKRYITASVYARSTPEVRDVLDAFCHLGLVRENKTAL